MRKANNFPRLRISEVNGIMSNIFNQIEKCSGLSMSHEELMKKIGDSYTKDSINDKLLIAMKNFDNKITLYPYDYDETSIIKIKTKGVEQQNNDEYMLKVESVTFELIEI